MITAQFCDSYLPAVDGVSILVKNYSYWLNKLLGPAYVVAPFFPGYDDANTRRVVRYFSIPTFVRRPFRIGLPQVDYAFRMTMRDQRFDLIHSHSPFFGGRMALNLARRKGIPFVASFHSKYREDFRAIFRNEPIVHKILNWIVDYYGSADEVWVPNSTTGEVLREYGYKASFEIVPNGTDFDGRLDRNRLRRLGNRDLATREDEFVFAFVGRLVWEKNLDFLIRALRAVKQKGKPFKMVFVGEGYARKRLESMVNRSFPSKEVAFLGVVKDRERLQRLLARADLLLFPSFYDNSPLIIREAAAFRLPTVVLEHSDAADGMKDGLNGFVARNTIEAYASKLHFLLEHPALVQKAGRGAFKTFCMPWKDIVEEVKERYLLLSARLGKAASA